MVIKMLDVRENLQGLAARLCAGDLSKGALERLRSTVREMRETRDAGDLDAATNADAQFHFLIGEYCGNEVLNEIIRHLEQAYRSSNRALMDLRGRTAISIREHARVVEAIARGDGAGAERAMRAHIGSVRRDLTAIPEAQP
jgi:DNA-binding GntR family transcriptional regulator